MMHGHISTISTVCHHRVDALTVNLKLLITETCCLLPLSGTLGDKQISAEYTTKAAREVDNFNRRFLDLSTGLYMDNGTKHFTENTEGSIEGGESNPIGLSSGSSSHEWPTQKDERGGYWAWQPKAQPLSHREQQQQQQQQFRQSGTWQWQCPHPSNGQRHLSKCDSGGGGGGSASSAHQPPTQAAQGMALGLGMIHPEDVATAQVILVTRRHTHSTHTAHTHGTHTRHTHTAHTHTAHTVHTRHTRARG
jgi:hypothetical protein